MKKRIFFIFFVAAISITACDNFGDPVIPEMIYDFSLTLTNNEAIPLSNTWVKAYYTNQKQELVVDSTYTSVLGTGNLRSLEPGDYTLKAFNASNTELGTNIITVEKDTSLNEIAWTIDTYVENYTFTVLLIDNNENPIAGRKVVLFTADANPVLIKEGISDVEGKILFTNTVVGEYKVLVYDAENTDVFAQTVSSVSSNSDNSETLIIKRILHNSDIVITGYMQDPKGADSPIIGKVSGGGFVHPGQYEYVQLMALKDIDFSMDNYSVVFTNTGSPNEYGWAHGIYDPTSKKVYQMNLDKGSVNKGQYFYVGGYSRMIASYYGDKGSQQLDESVFWGVDYYTDAGGNGNGAPKEGSGLLGNGSGKTQSTVTKTDPNAIAVFKGINVDENSIPQDAIFYGTEPTYQAFQIPDNDVYSRKNPDTEEDQPLFNQGTNTYVFPVGAQDQGMFIRLGGKVAPDEWLSPRIGVPIVFNINDYPSASTNDIENSDGCTVFVDK